MNSMKFDDWESYKAWAEDKTHHSVAIIPCPQLCATGETATIEFYKNKEPEIFYCPTLPEKTKTDALAHEITHFYLRHGRSYVGLRYIGKPEAPEESYAGYLRNMIEDLVVLKINEQIGFSRNFAEIIDNIKSVTNDIKQDVNHLLSLFPNEVFMNRQLTNSYIYAWGLLNYAKLRTNERKVIQLFLSTFAEVLANKEALIHAQQILDMIGSCDIHNSAQDYLIVIQKCVEMWELGDCIELVPF